jgi:hypothetical protein
MEPFALALLILATTVAPPPSTTAPADGLGLASTPVVRTPSGPPATTIPSNPPTVPSGGGLGIGVTAIALGFAARDRARRRKDDEPFFVLVHGDGGGPEDFDVLVDEMGIDPARTVAFDYRSAGPGATSTEASRSVPTRQAAEALDRLIRAVSVRHRNIYSIHHSRGGAVGVEMIAALDEGERPPIDGYRGAALLDPAIASGRLGWLQRFGALVTRVPDNGGFDPIRCNDGDGCRDIRAHLGEASDVSVIAIRNPDALVTNFVDEPPGLRTYDLINDGHESALATWWSIPLFVHRVFQAHSSVRTHPAVADCIAAEAREPGSCEWTADRRLPLFWWR